MSGGNPAISAHPTRRQIEDARDAAIRLLDLSMELCGPSMGILRALDVAQFCKHLDDLRNGFSQHEQSIRDVLPYLETVTSGIVEAGFKAEPTAAGAILAFCEAAIAHYDRANQLQAQGAGLPSDNPKCWFAQQLRADSLGCTEAGWARLRAAVRREAIEAIGALQPCHSSTPTTKPTAPKKQDRKRGAKQFYDHKDDKRIHDAWQSRRYESRKDLAKELGIGVKEVLLALDRHRKRSKSPAE